MCVCVCVCAITFSLFTCYLLSFFFFPFLFWLSCSLMEFLGQGTHLSQNFDLCHSCNNTASLTHCAGLEIKPASCCRDSVDLLCHSVNSYLLLLLLLLLFLPLLLFFFFRAAPGAYESSQPRGWIGATAASLHHSHSKAGSKLHLWPTPDLHHSSR